MAGSSNANFTKGVIFGNEVVKEHSGQNFQKIKFEGVLGMGQTIDFGHKEQNQSPFDFKSEFLNHLKHQESGLIQHQEINLQDSISKLTLEIKSLVTQTETPNKDIQKIPISQIPEANDYQVNFLRRITNFLYDLRKNISNSDVWHDSFNSKNKKKNSFWGKAKNKKTGGEQYLFSGEHSSARSVN